MANHPLRSPVFLTNEDGDGGAAIPVAGDGTAGTPSSGVMSVQGVASGTPVPSEIFDSNGDPLDYTTPAPTSPQKVIGQVTWTKTAFTLNGASQYLLAANANRVAFRVFNRAANAQVDVDIAGGTVAANTGETLLGGDSMWLEGAYCPVGAITIIGTNAQVVNVWEAV